MIPPVTRLPRLAIIGAGLSGLTLAGELDGFAEVTVFDKSPRVGGRIATRLGEDFQFDYGAQFFTARSVAFQNYLKPLIAIGRVAEWHPRVITLGDDRKSYRRDWFEPHYVATIPATVLLTGSSVACRRHSLRHCFRHPLPVTSRCAVLQCSAVTVCCWALPNRFRVCGRRRW